jgi:hypothetical protein
MTNQARENLSRLLDGDLSPEESEQLTREIEENHSLREHFESMKRIREAVALLAREDEPPAALDSLVEPLRRARPKMVSVRPAYKWLAAAATLVLGITVGLEVARSSMTRTDNSTTNEERYDFIGIAPSVVEKREIFRLQPMPRYKEDEEGPIGLIERLEATPAAFPDVDPPPVLDVIGPADIDPGDVYRQRESCDETGAKRREREALGATRRSLGSDVGESREQSPDSAKESPSLLKRNRDIYGLLTVGDGRPLRLNTPQGVASGEYRLIISVVAGVIREVDSIESGPTRDPETRRLISSVLVGLNTSSTSNQGPTIAVLVVSD